MTQPATIEANPMKAIRKKCLDCSGGSQAETRLCVVVDCPLWSCRMGMRPSTLLRNKPELADREWVLAESHKRGIVS